MLAGHGHAASARWDYEVESEIPIEVCLELGVPCFGPKLRCGHIGQGLEHRDVWKHFEEGKEVSYEGGH